MELKQKGIVKFQGFNVASSKVVTLKVKLPFNEMVTSVKLLQSLNSDVTIHAKMDGSKAVSLGMFSISSVTFDKDGNATAQFKSMLENVDSENICSLADSEVTEMLFRAIIELPEKEEE